MSALYLATFIAGMVVGVVGTLVVLFLYVVTLFDRPKGEREPCSDFDGEG